MQRAVIRAEIEPGKGMHNLCEYHYVEACHRASVRRVRDELGLKTVDEMKAFCRRKLRAGIFKPMPGATREPGQDDEEKAA